MSLCRGGNIYLIQQWKTIKKITAREVGLSKAFKYKSALKVDHLERCTPLDSGWKRSSAQKNG